MLNVAFRIVGNIADAEDVLQESFLDAFNKVKDFRQETTFGLWLKQIVVHRSINLLRKKKVEWVELGENELDGIADEVVDNDEEMQYQVAVVKQAMNKYSCQVVNMDPGKILFAARNRSTQAKLKGWSHAGISSAVFT